ncbi:energy transducer TonB [Sphingomonas panni]
MRRSMRKLLLFTMLLIGGCNKSPEPTHGVDTTLDESATASATPTPTDLSQEGIAEGGSPANDEPVPNSPNERSLSSLAELAERESASDRQVDTTDYSHVAVLKFPKENIISMDDYPPSSLRQGEEGAVAVEWLVDPSGRATDCRVTRSSGYETLDRVTCSIVQRRARYIPATSRDGTEISASDRLSVRWQLPNNR